MVNYCEEHATPLCHCPDTVQVPREAVEPDALRLRQALRYTEAAYQALADLPIGKFDGVFNAALHLKGAKDLLAEAKAKLPTLPTI